LLLESRPRRPRRPTPDSGPYACYRQEATGNQGYVGSAKRQAPVPVGCHVLLLRTAHACASVVYCLGAPMKQSTARSTDPTFSVTSTLDKKLKCKLSFGCRR
jgi:hypothetical protein